MVASDECGYGPWAGPLVVCAASAPIGWDDPRVRDSKDFDRESQREVLYDEFFHDPRFIFALSITEASRIDEIGIRVALIRGHAKVLGEVAARLQGHTLGVVDGTLPVHEFGLGFDLVALPKADQLVPECSLASIIGKVTRDRIMTTLDQKYPGYGFSRNKGYGGSAVHYEGLDKLGPCPEHRRSYAPIARRIAEREKSQQIHNAWEISGDELEDQATRR